MAFKMKGYTYPGKSPVKQGKGKNYEKSKGDQKGPIDEKQLKLQPSEHPDTWVYKPGERAKKDKAWVRQERIGSLEDRIEFITTDVRKNRIDSAQGAKDKANLEREAEIMRDRSKNK